MEALHTACETGDPSGELGRKVTHLHQRCLSFYWPSYSEEAHVSLVQIYVQDERFKDYCDAEQPGAAAFLRDAVLRYLGKQNGIV